MDRYNYWDRPCNRVFLARIKWSWFCRLIILLCASNLYCVYTLPNIPDQLWESKWYLRESISSKHKAKCLLSKLLHSIVPWSGPFCHFFSLFEVLLLWCLLIFWFPIIDLSFFTALCCANHDNNTFLFSYLKAKSYFSILYDKYSIFWNHSFHSWEIFSQSRGALFIRWISNLNLYCIHNIDFNWVISYFSYSNKIQTQ